MSELNAELPEAPELDPQIEAEARREGWKPKEEYSGPEDAWVDAETFVKRGREINPILRKNNERLQRELAAIRSELQESKQSIDKLHEYQANLTKKAYERALKTAREELRAARREGNLDAVDELEDQIDNLRENPPPEVEPPKKAAPNTPPDPMKDPVFAAWMGENPWMSDKNPELLDYANAVAMRLRRTQPTLLGRPFLDEIAAATKKAFPDKFEGTRRPGMVEGGTPPSGTPRSGGAKSITSLPQEAQKAFRELSGEKWYKDLAKSQNLTPEQLYLKDYEG